MASPDAQPNTRALSTAALLAGHADAWAQATRHAFLDAVREGTLPAGAFARWLVQDYLYVRDLLAFQGRLLGRAPRLAQQVLAGGLVALEAELTWFEQQATARRLMLDVERHPTTAAYNAFLLRLDDEPYVVGITALWALEQAYLEAWTHARPGHPDYREFVEHWTTPEFSTYVLGLEQTANAALETGADLAERTERAFLETVDLERQFWAMALAGARA